MKANADTEPAERGFTIVDGVAILDPVDIEELITDEDVQDLRLKLQR